MKFDQKVEAMKRAIKANGIGDKFNILKEAVKAGKAPRLTKDVRMIVERMIAEEAGRKWCSNCGRELTDPKSIELGIGPECRGNKRREKAMATAYLAKKGGEA